MEENFKYIDKEQFFNELKKNHSDANLDDFEKEAIEGWKLVKDIESRRKNIDSKINLLTKNENSKTQLSKRFYRIGIAASILLVIGLIFLIGPKINPDKNEVVEAQEKEQSHVKITDDKKIDQHSNINEVTVKSDSIFISPGKDLNLNKNSDKKTITLAEDLNQFLNEENQISEKDAEVAHKKIEDVKGSISDNEEEKIVSITDKTSSEPSVSATYAWTSDSITNKVDNNLLEMNNGTFKEVAVKKNENANIETKSTRVRKNKSKRLSSSGVVSNQNSDDMYNNQILNINKLNDLKISLFEENSKFRLNKLERFPGDLSKFEEYIFNNIDKNKLSNKEIILEISILSNGELEIPNQSAKGKEIEELIRVLKKMPNWETGNKISKYKIKISKP
ncbi:MAG: hypothetical protein ACK5D5_13305 [Bacteroidota bacterium]